MSRWSFGEDLFLPWYGQFEPAFAEAARVSAEHRPGSSHEMESLAEDLGIPIGYPETLPRKVKGFPVAAVEMPHILVNSNRPAVDRNHVIAYGIGYCRLYALNRPESDYDRALLDVQAELFAISLLARTGKSDEIQKYLDRNPKARTAVGIVGLSALIVLGIGAVTALLSWLSSRNPETPRGESTTCLKSA